MAALVGLGLGLLAVSALAQGGLIDDYGSSIQADTSISRDTREIEAPVTPSVHPCPPEPTRSPQRD